MSLGESPTDRWIKNGRERTIPRGIPRGGEARTRMEIQQTRRVRGPACDYGPHLPPVKPVPREELLALALLCEAGWRALQRLREPA